MATLVKTPSNTWKAVIRRKGWPTTARTFRIKRDAEDWARNVEDEMRRGIFVARASTGHFTVKSALERYLREVTPTKKPSTQITERKKAKILVQRLGQYGLAVLTPDLVANYRDERLAEGKSPNTVRLDMALLGHLYTTAIREWGLGLVYNPVANVRRPSSGQGRNRRLSWSEMRRLLRECDAHSNPMLGWSVRIALYTAMRQGEILSLTRDQVNLQRRIVYLTDTKNNSARTVPLSNRAANVFRQVMANPVRPPDTDLLFFGEPGRDDIRRPYCINKVWSDAVKRAGISNLRFHDLRHESVSRLVELGLTDQEVAAISGHKSMQMLKRYTHLRAEDLVDRLDTAKRR